MVKSIDPARMTREQRLAELGELLAAGVQRVLARGINPGHRRENSPDPLAGTGEVEAQCARPAEDAE